MRALLSVVCLLLFGPMVLAQDNVSGITGIVSDANRAAVPGALIQAQNTETGNTYKSSASPTGNYTLSQLPPGKYELSVSAFLLNPYQQKDIVIQAGQTLRIDIQLGVPLTLHTLGDDYAAFAAVLSRRQPPAGPAPRTADNKPNLSGIWAAATIDPDEADTPDMLPWAAALAKERAANDFKDWPSARCLPNGVEVMPALFLNKIVQTPDLLVVINEGDVPGYHQVFLDGRGHPKDMEPTWIGHSTGKWEGETLVIDTAGFNDKSWLGDVGVHTEMLNITTRLRRLDLGHLEVETTYIDSGTFTKPWKTKRVFVLAPDDEIQEWICNENNQYPIGK